VRMLLVVATRGPGRPELLRCHQGRLACLTGARAKGGSRPVGPESQEEHASGMGSFPFSGL
jgi:hypothetical protein